MGTLTGGSLRTYTIALRNALLTVPFLILALSNAEFPKEQY